MNPVLLPWLAEIGVVTYRTMSGTSFAVTGGKVIQQVGPNRPPLPSELLSVFIVFGAYSVIGSKDARIGALLGWGTVLATILMLAQHGTPAPNQSGTFPPSQTLSQRNQLIQPLPNLPNYPPGS